jgi:hypothetical protein
MSEKNGRGKFRTARNNHASSLSKAEKSKWSVGSHSVRVRTLMGHYQTCMGEAGKKMNETASTETFRKHKKKNGVMPKDYVKAALIIMRQYGYEAKRKCPIYKGFCLFPICSPHLSCIFCQGRLAKQERLEVKGKKISDQQVPGESLIRSHYSLKKRKALTERREPLRPRPNPYRATC